MNLPGLDDAIARRALERRGVGWTDPAHPCVLYRDVLEQAGVRDVHTFTASTTRPASTSFLHALIDLALTGVVVGVVYVLCLIWRG